MRIPKLARRKAKELFRLCQSNGSLDKSAVEQALARLLEIRPRGYLAILVHLQQLIRLEEEQRSARIESAAPLSPQLQSAMRSSLEHQYGSGLTFEFVQKPELLGGIRVQVGSDVYDGTVSARLTELREAFEVS